MISLISCIAIFIVSLYIIVYKRNKLHFISLIATGIYVPLLLYELDWSELIDTTNSSIFNYIIFISTLLIIFFSLFTSSKRISWNNNYVIVQTAFGKHIGLLLNLLFVVLYLLENYMGSGTIVPALKGIDIHNKYYAPVISYFTNASYLFLAFDYLSYKATKSKKYIVYFLIVSVLPVVTRSSRMIMVMSLMQVFMLYLTFSAPSSSENKNKSKPKTFIMFAVLIVIAVGLMEFTNYRMSHYGTYDINYADTTQWSGPTWLKWLAPFYGYFALSFNNLKINILYRHIVHNYIGYYSFAGFWMGLLHFNSIFNLTGASVNNLVTSGAANVATGFWDFYYDFGYLFFIPLVVALLFVSFLFVKASDKTYTLTYRVLYCWYAVNFFFMSFQNTLSTTLMLIHLFMIWFIVKYSFKIYTNKLEAS